MKRPSAEDFGGDRHRRVRVPTDEIEGHDGGPVSRSPSIATTPGYKTPQTHSSGRRFFGCSKISDYHLSDKVGEGTFGEVHKARRSVDGKLVALKRILMHKEDNGVLIHKEENGIPITAIREIKILKSLSHKNVVPLIDIAVERPEPGRKDQGSVYMVFPYMDHDLAGLLENPSVTFTIPQVKTYMMQLLKGTAYLHHNHIMHRDMKAANLLINNEGILQIADFGLARAMEEGREGYTKGVVTRWYRPPELFFGADNKLIKYLNYAPSIDMWGVGCVFAEMLCERPILQGQDDIDQLKLIFKLCGSPTSDDKRNWFNKLPDANKVSFDGYPRRIKERFSRMDKNAVDLIDRLLVLNPAKRLTAIDALRHNYFYVEPLPAKPADLSKYESSHEMDRRKHGNGQRVHH